GFRHPIGSWIVDNGPSTVFIDFCAWTSNAAPAHSVQLTYNAATSRWEGDYSEYQPGWKACLAQIYPGYYPGCVAGSTCVTVSDATCQGEPVPSFILQCINSDCCTEECPTGGPPPWHEVPLDCY
ncbi:MAG TPA: hypothetical protein VLC93_19720, partial [Myxococcota bacterium]|nr:hypothetical protein [Myxococcota bacterium]